MKDYQIKSSKNKETNGLEIALTGHLNVSNISKIQHDFNALVKNSKKIAVNISEVEDADISLIQMIEGFKQKCKNSDIGISIVFNLTTDTSELFKRAGLTNMIN